VRKQLRRQQSGVRLSARHAGRCQLDQLARSAALGFAALIGSCGLFARRFAAQHDRAWVTYSSVTGVVFLFGFIGVAGGSGATWSVLGFWVAVILAWSWITTISLRYRSALTEA